MKKVAFICLLSLIISFQVFGIDMSFVGTPDKKLEFVFDLENLGVLTGFKTPVKTGKIQSRYKVINYTIKKLKFYLGYRLLFGEAIPKTIKNAEHKTQKLITFHYPADGFEHLGLDADGIIWSINNNSQKKIGMFALRPVTDLDGNKKTLKMHRLNHSKFWSCARDGRVLVDKGDGKLQTLGYVDWFYVKVDGERVLLPMTAKVGYPVRWTGRLGKRIITVNQKDIEKLVQTAINDNDLDALKTYLTHDPDILKKIESKNSRSLLLSVLRNAYNDKKYPLIEFLVNNGYPVNKSDQSGEFPIHRALDLQSHALTQLFLNKGADPNQIQTRSKVTPLHLAAQGRVYLENNRWVRKSNPVLVEMLLKKGATVDPLDSNKRTPLHYAAQYLNMFSAEKLLQAGAKVNIQDNLGDTPGMKAGKGWDWEYDMCHNNCQNRTREKYFFRNEEMIHLLEHYGSNWKISNNKNENYYSLLLDEKFYNEDYLPSHLKAKKSSLAKYTKFWKMKYLVANSSYQDMLNAFGEPHQFKQKECFAYGKVYDCAIFWYWSDKAYHKFVFKDLFVYTPPKKMTLNIAAYGGENKQLTLDNLDRKTKLTGGKLIDFISGGNHYFPIEFDTNIKPASLKLYESGNEIIKTEDRNYATTFKSHSARYLNWELSLTHDPDKYKKYFVINVDFFKDGKLSESTDKLSFIKKGRTTSMHESSWGNDDPGYWTKGKYKILLSVTGKKIAEKEFQVE